jgi:hypothetical protein
MSEDIPSSPNSNLGDDEIMDQLVKNLKPTENDNTSVAGWLLKEFTIHKDRIIKGYSLFSKKLFLTTKHFIFSIQRCFYL